jgi:hypothetical protein
VCKGLRSPAALLALCCAAFLAVCSAASAQTTPPGTTPSGTTVRPPGTAPQGPATNQTTRAPTTGRPKEATTARSESVLRRPLADAPEGIPFDDFVFHARGEVDIEYDDNIYRTPTDRRADGIVRFRPGITLQSQWDEHALDFYAQAEFGQYFTNTSENYIGFAVGTRGRYDVDEETQINGLLEFNRSVLPRGSPGVGAVPGAVTSSVIRASADVTYNGEPIYARFGPLYEYRFFDGSGPSDNHNYLNLQGRIGYRISEEFSVFIDPSVQFVRYISVPDSTGFNRNSQGFDVKVGVTYDITTELGMEVAVGYYRRWYEDSRLVPDGGISARAAIYWNPTPDLSFEFEGRRSLTEYRLTAANTGTVPSGNAVETSFSLRGGYLILENLLFDAGFTYANYYYDGINRTDNYYGADLGLRWFFSPNFYLGPRYYYTTRNSTDPTQNFYDNRILLTLGARL